MDIALTTDGSVAFGPRPLSFTVDTTSVGIDDVETLQVVQGPADLFIKTTPFGDGGNSWALGTTNGANQVVWAFSTNGSSYTPFVNVGELMTLQANVPEGNTIDIYFRLTMPASTSSMNQHSATVTLVAVAPPP